MPHKISKECTGCTACARQCPVGAISGKRNDVHHISTSICIDCGVCGMVCSSSAILDSDGNNCKKVSPKNRPKPFVDSELCSGCRACVSICPFNCLETGNFVMPFEVMGITELAKSTKCVSCREYERICTKGAITLGKAQKEIVSEVS